MYLIIDKNEQLIIYVKKLIIDLEPLIPIVQFHLSIIIFIFFLLEWVISDQYSLLNIVSIFFSL